MDEYGRLMPAVNRFPSSANGAGFKPLADYVHSKGLKFGIHIMRGIPRQAVERNLPIRGTSYHAADVADKDNGCRWNPDMWGVDTTKPGSQVYYDSIADLYASWGVDFIKADDMGSHLYQPAEMKALSMLAVSERLSEVRGQIEQQQAEFNALSRQIETVAIAISLRTESEARVFGLNWRPGYQLKLALHDGLESIATYATTMTTILVYLPAVLLWAGTILIGIVVSWRVRRWMGERWFRSKTPTVSAQG